MINLLAHSDAARIAVEHFAIGKRPAHAILQRLDALIMAMKDCKGKSCSRPWATLHPKGDVNSLKEALNPRFDGFYDGQPKMYFDSCEVAFIKEKESNEPVNQYAPTHGRRPEYDFGAEWILAT